MMNTHRHKTNMNSRGVDAGQWPYIVALVLGLLALAFFAWVVLQARSADVGIFEQLGRAIGR